MHSSLFRNTQDCLTHSNPPYLDIGFQFLPSQNAVEMDAAQREAESLGWGSRVAYCTISFNSDRGVTCDTLSEILVSDTFQKDEDVPYFESPPLHTVHLSTSSTRSVPRRYHVPL